MQHILVLTNFISKDPKNLQINTMFHLTQITLLSMFASWKLLLHCSFAANKQRNHANCMKLDLCGSEICDTSYCISTKNENKKTPKKRKYSTKYKL